MKNYIGTKEVKAQPMTAEEAIEKGYKVNNHTGDGYEVEYKDGYKSWSPKDVFEGSYKLIETHLDVHNMKKVLIILYVLILGLLMLYYNIEYPQLILINTGALFYISNTIIKIFKL